MAVGYSHVATVKVLLEAGANPEIPDNQGRNVVALVDSLRETMPMSPQLAGKRIALEEVSALLTGEQLCNRLTSYLCMPPAGPLGHWSAARWGWMRIYAPSVKPAHKCCTLLSKSHQ